MAWYNDVNDWSKGSNPLDPRWLEKRMHGGEATKGLDTTGANTGYVQHVASMNLNAAGNRQAPMASAAQLGSAAQLSGGPQDQARGQQQQTAGFLQGIMSGQNAGAGEIAVNRQVGQAQAAQQAQARMARGGNAALAARGAARNQADIGLAGAGQAAQAQMQDQQGAAGQLGGVLQGMRGQDLDFAGQNAQLQQQRMLAQGGFDQQTGLANQASRLQQMGMNDAATAGYMQTLMGLDQNAYQRELAKRQIAMGDRGSAGNVFNAGGGMIAQYAGQSGQK